MSAGAYLEQLKTLIQAESFARVSEVASGLSTELNNALFVPANLLSVVGSTYWSVGEAK